MTELQGYGGDIRVDLDPVERTQRHAAVGKALEDLYSPLPEEHARRAAESV